MKTSLIVVSLVTVAATVAGDAHATPRPLPRRAPAPPPSAYETMTEPDLARVAVRYYLGQLDRVDVAGNQPDGRDTQGQFTITSSSDLGAFRKRVDAIVHRQQPDDNVGHALCVRRAILEDGKTDADATTACKPQETQRAWLDEGNIASDPVLRSMYVDWMLAAVGDAAFAAETHRTLVDQFGWTGTRLRYHVDDPRVSNVTGNVLQYSSVAMAAWSRKTLRAAIHYAKDQALDAAVVGQLQTALAAAPAFRCRWDVDVVVEQYQGRGGYGAMQRAGNDVVVRPDNPVGVGGELPCGDAAKVRSDASLFAVIKHGVTDPAAVTATTFGMDWEIERDAAGTPIKRTRLVKVFRRVEY
jgi:hypothetical protein